MMWDTRYAALRNGRERRPVVWLAVLLGLMLGIVGGATAQRELVSAAGILPADHLPAQESISSSLAGPSGRRDHTAIYDSANQRMVVFGGAYTQHVPLNPTCCQYQTAYLNDVWARSLNGASTWTQLAPTGMRPPARAEHTAIYDSANQRMIVFGGYSLDYSSDFRMPREYVWNDVWALSLSGTPTWTPLTPTGPGPPARTGHTAIYDSANQRMIIFGGRSVAGGVYLGEQNDVWALSLSDTPTWTQLAPTGTAPPARAEHTAIYDSANQRMVIFGGYSQAGGTFLADVWTLSLSDPPTWTQLAPTGTAPPARAEHTAIYDSANQRMIIFGGYSYSGASGFRGNDLNDVWALSLSGTPTWTRLPNVLYLPLVSRAAGISGRR